MLGFRRKVLWKCFKLRWEIFMRKTLKRVLAAAATAAMVLTATPIASHTGTPLQVVALAKNDATIHVGGSVKIYVKNSYGTVLSSSLYSVSNKKVVSVKKSGKYFKVTGKKAGSAAVTLRRSGRKYTFKIKVKNDYGRNVSISTDPSPLRDGTYLCKVKNKNNFAVRVWVKEKGGVLEDIYVGAKASFYHVLKHYPKSIKVEKDTTVYANTPKISVRNVRYTEESAGELIITFDASSSTTKTITRTEYLFVVKYSDNSFDIVKSDFYENPYSGLETGILNVNGSKSIVGVYPLVGEVRCFK